MTELMMVGNRVSALHVSLYKQSYRLSRIPSGHRGHRFESRVVQWVLPLKYKGLANFCRLQFWCFCLPEKSRLDSFLPNGVRIMPKSTEPTLTERKDGRVVVHWKGKKMHIMGKGGTREALAATIAFISKSKTTPPVTFPRRASWT